MIQVEGSNCVHFLTCQTDSWSLEHSPINVNDEDVLLDATMVTYSNLICLGKKGMYLARLEEAELKVTQLSGAEVILDEISQCTDPIPLTSLYKKVEFGNLNQYKAGKEEKMQRKRKMVY